MAFGSSSYKSDGTAEDVSSVQRYLARHPGESRAVHAGRVLRRHPARARIVAEVSAHESVATDEVAKEASDAAIATFRSMG
jgi:hypothetical protein